MSRFKEIMGKVYDKFLWTMGFLDGEKITYMLRRQKDRLGGFYYLLLGASLLLFNCLLVKSIVKKRWGWLAFWILFDLFLVWLLPHIYGIKILF